MVFSIFACRQIWLVRLQKDQSGWNPSILRNNLKKSCFQCTLRKKYNLKKQLFSQYALRTNYFFWNPVITMRRKNNLFRNTLLKESLNLIFCFTVFADRLELVTWKQELPGNTEMYFKDVHIIQHAMLSRCFVLTRRQWVSPSIN